MIGSAAVFVVLEVESAGSFGVGAATCVAVTLGVGLAAGLEDVLDVLEVSVDGAVAEVGRIGAGPLPLSPACATIGPAVKPDTKMVAAMPNVGTMRLSEEPCNLLELFEGSVYSPPFMTKRDDSLKGEYPSVSGNKASKEAKSITPFALMIIICIGDEDKSLKSLMSIEDSRSEPTN